MQQEIIPLNFIFIIGGIHDSPVMMMLFELPSDSPAIILNLKSLRILSLYSSNYPCCPIVTVVGKIIPNTPF